MRLFGEEDKRESVLGRQALRRDVVLWRKRRHSDTAVM